MGSRYYYAPLSANDKQYLRTIAARRWKTAGKRFLLSALLPMVIVVPMLLILNLVILANIDEAQDAKDINIPPGIENFSLLWYALPVFLLLAFVNFIMFVRSIPPVYIDISRGRKKQLIFQPKPYTLSESHSYFIQTSLPVLRFIEVTPEQYMQMDYSRLCYLEVAPLTNVPLGFKTVESIE